METNGDSRSFVFVTFDGGGNLPPNIGIAEELVSRGHSVRFLGHRSQAAHVQARGLKFHAYMRTPDYDAALPVSPDELAAFLFDHIFFEPMMAADLQAELSREPGDAVIVDCLLPAPLAALESLGVPSAVLVHTLYSFFDGWDLDTFPRSDRLADLRSSLGLGAVEHFRDTWRSAGRVFVTSPLEFDVSNSNLPANTIHVGPIAERPAAARESTADWGSTVPLVLVSFSTTYMDQENVIDRVLSSLESLPVRILVTTGSGVERSALRQTSNAVIRDFVTHDEVLPHARLAVCHGGHGTVMAALKHGVPLVCIPLGRDQPLVAGRVEAAGAGVRLGPTADADTIRRAVAGALEDPRLAAGARRMAGLIGRSDGARVAASHLEAMVSERPALAG